MNSVRFFRSCSFVDALIGMRDQHLRVLLEIGRDFDGRDVLRDRVEALQRVGGQEEVDLADRQQDAVVHARAARHDGHVEPVFAVGAVGQRLVEAAVLGLGHPVGAEGDLVERLSRGRAGRARHRDGDSRQCGAKHRGPRHRLLLATTHATIEHDPEKWIPVFGKDHAQRTLHGRNLRVSGTCCRSATGWR